VRFSAIVGLLAIATALGFAGYPIPAIAVAIYAVFVAVIH
jgi:hypothetical protein